MRIKIIVFVIFGLMVTMAAFGQTENTEALKIQLDKARQSNNTNNIIYYLNKLGHAYWKENSLDRAVESFKELQDLTKKIGNTGGVERLYNILGQIYYEKGDNENAIAAYSESLAMKRRGGYKEAIVSELLNLASIYTYTENRQKAISAYNEALNIALELNNLIMLRSAYGGLTENYNALGQADKAMQYYEDFVRLDRHMKQSEFKDFASKSAARIREVDSARFRSERELSLQSKILNETQDSLITSTILNRQRQLEITNLEQEKQLQESKIREQEAQVRYEKNLRNYFIIAFFVLLIFVAWMFFLYRTIRKTNVALEEKNALIILKSTELEQTNFELNVKNRKIEEQKDELTKQKDELTKKNLQITESITYASKIQKAILPADIAIRSEFPHSFVYFRPRDIVSGDFYWYVRHNQTVWMAAVDCTGHSVPGAFMSMMGYSLLNEIVNEKRIDNPVAVLHALDKGVINALHQRNSNVEATDGLEISLMKYDIDNRRVHLVNTNQTIVLYQNEKFEIIEGDYYSIGGDFLAFENKEFIEKVFDVEPGAKVFLFSDGFEDQFGGPHNKKFLFRNFLSVMKENIHKSMIEQEKGLDVAFTEWRSGHEQTDDVLVIGIEF